MTRKAKEATQLTGSVTLESEYFLVSAGKTVSLQSSPGYEAPSIPVTRAILKEWESSAAPILEKIRQALEKRLSTVQSSIKLPLLKYRQTTWVIFEEDVPEFARTEQYGLKGRPFGYAMRFDEQGIQVVVVFAALPKKKLRASLREDLEHALEKVPVIPDASKGIVGTKPKEVRNILDLLR
ncbi:MAG: hypothetical protein HYU39_06210 [Thaumarchaeota archaeon]|nr:hypothetical protein [Nitrososphaerota archaeon]